ncbi:hypothetical protein HIM_07014 [Hirsutella minnesotensis 3608]|uniref:Uncharacterized protein n=1 Tax=Hirsutella minnesotensis 3608 TaxID=1043627 RepID=A0A0F7ZIG6_9HYPO|nr:hypothetical protein HIM_07014 [Hirsutella minnesotensis 3608]
MKAAVVLFTALVSIGLAAPGMVAPDMALEKRGGISGFPPTGAIAGGIPAREQQSGQGRTTGGRAGNLDRGAKSGCAGPGCGPTSPQKNCFKGSCNTS